MKVLHIIGGGDVGGAKTAVISLLSRLTEKKDVTIRLVSLREGDFSKDAIAAGIDTVVIPTSGLRNDLQKLADVCRDFQPDILHSHGSRANLYAALLRSFLQRSAPDHHRLPLVSTIHSDYRMDYLGSPRKALTNGTLNMLALRHVDFFTCVSDRMVDTMISRGFEPQHCFAIYNGIDYTNALPKPDPAIYWASCGVPWEKDDVICCIAARLTAVKDIPTLLKAFAAALPDAPHLRLVIAGDGEDRQALENLASSLGISARVSFLGWVNDTATLFAASDINVICSLSETFPYSVSEGILQHCATVVTDVGGLNRLVLNGINGYCVQPRDYTALGKALETLALDENKRKEFTEKLFERASTHFSLDSMAADQTEIYHTVLRRWRQRGTRNGVTICGAYGKGNAGDDALLSALLKELREIDKDLPITVLSVKPKSTRLEQRVHSVFTFHLPAVLHSFRHSKLYINGGGSLIQDVTSRRSLKFYLWTLSAAKRVGANVMMYGCGIGPLIRKNSKQDAARVLNASVDLISLRDPDSRELLRSLGIQKPDIRLAADPALTLPAASPKAVELLRNELGLASDKRYFAVAPRPWKNFEQTAPAIAAACRYAYETYHWIPLLFPIELPRDNAACDSLEQLLDVPFVRIHRPLSTGEIIGLIQTLDGVLSMRLHALVFAAAAGIPLAGISYDCKVSGFLHSLQDAPYCALCEADEKTLCALIDRLAAADRAQVRKNAAKLREQEHINAVSLKEMLEKPLSNGR